MPAFIPSWFKSNVSKRDISLDFPVLRNVFKVLTNDYLNFIGIYHNGSLFISNFINLVSLCHPDSSKELTTLLIFMKNVY